MCPLAQNLEGTNRFMEALTLSVLILFLLNLTYYIHRVSEDIL